MNLEVGLNLPEKYITAHNQGHPSEGFFEILTGDMTGETVAHNNSYDGQGTDGKN